MAKIINFSAYRGSGPNAARVKVRNTPYPLSDASRALFNQLASNLGMYCRETGQDPALVLKYCLHAFAKIREREGAAR
jgi:hypothetical protein